MNNFFLNPKYKERDKKSNKSINNATTDIFENSSTNSSTSVNSSVNSSVNLSTNNYDCNKSVDSSYSSKTISSESKDEYIKYAGTELDFNIPNYNLKDNPLSPNSNTSNDSSLCNYLQFEDKKLKDNPLSPNSNTSNDSSLCNYLQFEDKKLKDNPLSPNSNTSNDSNSSLCTDLKFEDKNINNNLYEKTEINYGNYANNVVDIVSIDTKCENNNNNYDCKSTKSNNVYPQNADIYLNKSSDSSSSDLDINYNKSQKINFIDNATVSIKYSDNETDNETTYNETYNETTYNKPDNKTTCNETCNETFNETEENLNNEYTDGANNNLTTNIFKDTSSTSESIHLSDDTSVLSDNEYASNIICKKGDKGEKGIQGCKGNKGDQGIIGSKGDQGDIGQKGNNGQIGQTGQTGINGQIGPRGYRGVDGEKGNKGCIGEKGNVGTNGLIGPIGLTGPIGPRGLDGGGGSGTFLGGIPGPTSGLLWLETRAIDDNINNIKWQPLIENNFINIYDQDNKYLEIKTPGIYSLVFRISLELTNPIVIYKADDINFYKRVMVKIEVRHNENNIIYSQEAFLGAELSKNIYNIPFYINLEENDKISIDIKYLNNTNSGINLITSDSNFTYTKLDIIYIG